MEGIRIRIRNKKSHIIQNIKNAWKISDKKDSSENDLDGVMEKAKNNCQTYYEGLISNNK